MKNRKGYNKQHKVTETNTRIKELNSIKELIAKNSYGKANAELIRYMERYPNDMFGIFLYGKLQYKYRELKTAKEAFNRVANSDSNNKYSAMCVLGNIAVDECDYDTARMHYKKAITESPTLEIFAILGWSRMERRIKNVERNYRSPLANACHNWYRSICSSYLYNLLWRRHKNWKNRALKHRFNHEKLVKFCWKVLETSNNRWTL